MAPRTCALYRHQDLGLSIATELVPHLSPHAEAENLTWFSSYHPYTDHEQYYKDLQASFPTQSELLSSGTSHEGRDIFGIHLWGAGGPGKPAVVWHGTVHAREWITAMVNITFDSVHLKLIPSGC
jgi:zinc carboxypeptidase